MDEKYFRNLLDMATRYKKKDTYKSDGIPEEEKLLWTLANICYNIGYHNGRQEESLYHHTYKGES